MCRWGCETTDTTYMCKWCGTRYCRECLRGDFSGHMKEPTKCRKCNQVRCQGVRVDYVIPPKGTQAGDKKGSKSVSFGSKSRSSSPSKSKTSDKSKSGKSPKKAKGSKKKKK